MQGDVLGEGTACQIFCKKDVSNLMMGYATLEKI
jgi:hypothetical protein